MSSNDEKIGVFTGVSTQFTKWEMSILGEALSKGYAKPLREERPADLPQGANAADVQARQKEQRVWDDAAARLVGLLIKYTDGVPQLMVHRFVQTLDGRGAYLALKAKYELTGLAAVVEWERQLSELKLREGEDPDGFLSTFHRIMAALQALGQGYAEERWKGMILFRLPPSYAEVKSILESRPGVNMAQIEEALRSLYRTRQAQMEASGDTATALVAKGPKKGCHICGEMDHWKRECPQLQKNGSGGKKYGVRHNQFKGKKHFRPNPKHAHLTCDLCHQRGHIKPVCPNREDKDGNKKMPHVVLAAQVAKREQEPSLEGSGAVIMRVDSGATDHFISTKEGLTNIRPIAGEPVGGYYGSMGQAVAIADFQGWVADIHGEAVGITLRNVYYVPGGKYNLLSVSQVKAGGVA